ncbi:hypothetical protein ADICEAN_02888 [Cesiribacter andamanensis AMV16]|uniref:Uncharacterized protein n=1 Tax=Cesiribacter andamanensis AMV16 TaxID=1279009 RepID=M7N455_9BACT|nr:hypothetical protein ADICEAN_02888 [Cesiribacter andamanensis AMV16]
MAKALGLEAYRQLVASLPPHLQQGFVADRLQEKVEPLLASPSEGEWIRQPKVRMGVLPRPGQA